MQKELTDLVEAVRNGRGMDQAMLAAQVSLLLANNPGKATLHDPATAGPDDLARRLVATVGACGDAAIAPSAYTWEDVEKICKAVINAIANLEPIDLSAPSGCSTHCECLAGCACAHCTQPAGWRTVEIEGKQYTLDENARPKNDAEIAILARAWGVTESKLNVALGRAVRTKPVGPPTVPTSTSNLEKPEVEVHVRGCGCKDCAAKGYKWRIYPDYRPDAVGQYPVKLMSGEATWRNATRNEFGAIEFPDALDPMNSVVEWYG